MDGHVIDRADGRVGGDAWEGEFVGARYNAGICVVMVSSRDAGYGPRLHQHPYPETFIIRRGRARFTVGNDEMIGRAGQIIVVPAFIPHSFRTFGPYEAVDIHANNEIVTEWLE
ncbi:cupin domain-containing protein [Brevibacterium yomogidense]|uniref:cupin domain-containing protein n=1 Tax=Brevibacterium yomogidense TaxID=946573 RepID=UPI0018DF7398|nr:cupin domain-containing protein [Brevibacterium yomogidense]